MNLLDKLVIAAFENTRKSDHDWHDSLNQYLVSWTCYVLPV